MRAAARSEALTTTQGPGVDGLLVQRKVGAVGHEGVREDPVVRFLALRNWAGPCVHGPRSLAPVLLAGLVKA